MITFNNLNKFYVDDYVKDVFLTFYQLLFSQNESEFKYSPDKQVTKLNIADQFSFDDLTPEVKPTIYIRRHPFSFMNTSIDTFLGAGSAQGSNVYTDLIMGAVDIVCLSQVELEACRLAGIVFMLTNQFRHSLLQGTGLFRVDVKTLGSAQPLSAQSTMRLVEVPVTIQVIFQYSWMVENMGKHELLANIDITRSTNLVTGSSLHKEGDDGELVKVCIPMTGPTPEDIIQK